MLRLLQYAAMLDMVVVTHAEDAGIAGNAAATAGEMATRLGLAKRAARRPRRWRWRAISRWPR